MNKKIIYWDLFSNNILIFINNLKKYYKTIYFDTWLVNEEQIIHWYISKSDSLYNEIIDKIEDTIEKWYLWNIFETKLNYEKSKLVISIRSYTLKVIIKRINNDIFVEDILF